MAAINNILITGAAGFLKPILASKLLRNSANRVVLTDLMAPAPPKGFSDDEQCICVGADLTVGDGITPLLTTNPALSTKVNIEATQALLTAASFLSGMTDYLQPARAMTENFVRVMEAPSDAMPAHIRAMEVGAMCGEEKLALLKVERNVEAERLLKSWPQASDFANAKRLGLVFDSKTASRFSRSTSIA
ncbi:hypothetical protein MY11210_008427 [Beauveria gryllotalpidicola]